MPKLKKQSQSQSSGEAKRRRKDETVRQSHRVANADAMKEKRLDEAKREVERVLDLEAKRLARLDEAKGEAEQVANSEARRLARLDEAKQEVERVLDLEARRLARLDKPKRQAERIKDAEAHRIRRQEPELCLSDFEKSIKHGPTVPCQSCDGLFFKSSTKKTKRKSWEEKYNKKFCGQVLRPINPILDDDAENNDRVCSTCYSHINEGRFPKLCFTNGFCYPPIPERPHSTRRTPRQVKSSQVILYFSVNRYQLRGTGLQTITLSQ